MTNPMDANACNERGIQLAEQGLSDQAAQAFRRAIELDPRSAPPRDNLATLLAEEGDLLSALEQYIAAIRAEGDSAPAYNYLGAFLAHYSSELMLGCYRRCLELDPYSVEASFNLGLALIEMDRTTEAFVPLTQALNLEPDNLDIKLELGIALTDVGRYTEAIKQLRSVLKQDPQQAEAWIYLGRAFAGKGLYSEAERFLSHAQERNPANVGLMFELARVYNQWQGKRAELAQWLKRAAACNADELLHLIRRDPHGTVMIHAAGLEHLLDDRDLSKSDVGLIT